MPFDPAPTLAAYAAERVIERCGVLGHLQVEELRPARPAIGTFLRWRRQTCPERPLTMELLDDFARVDSEKYTSPSFRLDGSG